MVALVICIAPSPNGPPICIQAIASVSPQFSLAPSTLRVRRPECPAALNTSQLSALMLHKLCKKWHFVTDLSSKMRT